MKERALTQESLASRSEMNYVFGPSSAINLPQTNVAHCYSLADPKLSHLKSIMVSGLFDQGTAKIAEDIVIARPPFFAVLDGTSGVFYPGRDPLIYKDGMTGGQVAGDLVKDVIASTPAERGVAELLSRANDAVANTHREMGLSLSEPGTLGGVVGVVAKIGEKTTEIAQWGDCFFSLTTTVGQSVFAENQVFAHDNEMRAVIADLMIKYDGDRTAMWKEFGPRLIEERNKQINAPGPLGYGFLCGQAEFLDRVNFITIPTAELNRLTIFSDGLVFFPDSGTVDNLADTLVVGREHERGIAWLQSILSATREKERMVEHLTHVSHGEAAALLLEF